MITVQAKSPSPGSYTTDKWTTNTRVDSSTKGTTCQAQSKAEVSARSRVVSDSWVRADQLPNSDWLTKANMPHYIGSFQGGLTTCVRRYETISTHIHSGAIVLSKLDVPPGRHALDIIAVGLVTGLLDRLPSRGEYKKVIHCDILC